ncbi:hypothetical protein PYW08_002493 [Mythimna loreyi]|uniref:Uncharacterized protein n=1 Tax=Mythimna loreyi TaxID=667449 RepID=A0ACC2QI62_9NEOP|nr:hypothetical protein PYW08_002493 [Mythimna loreyi]
MNTIFKISRRMLSISHRNCNVCCTKPDYGPLEVQRCVLLNGTGVVGAKVFGGQIAVCTVMFQAGSRYEVDDYLGATHFLRAASTASSCAFSGFTKMRYLAQHGASLICTSDRQSIAYTLRCPVTIFSQMKCFLQDTVLRCFFRQWEIDDLKPMIKDDLHRIHPLQRVIDLAQKACWAGPLSNSMFCEEARIQGMTGKLLNCYANWNYKSDHCSIASVGVPFEETVQLAESIEPCRVRPPQRPGVCSQPRGGFEYHDLGPGCDTWICVVVPGCGTNDITELMRHSIVAHACGTDNMQEGSHSMDVIPEYPLGVLSAGDLYTTFRAFNISYYETGVFGIVAKTRSCTAWDVAKAAAQFLSNVGDLDFSQIEVGKKRLKVSLAINDEDCIKLTEGLALQFINNVQIDSAKTAMKIVDSIPNQEIKDTAKKLGSKMDDLAVAVVGDLGSVPHDKELLCR